MPGPIGHGVTRALREARDKQALAPRRGKRRPPPRWHWWVLVTLALVCLAIVLAAVVASRP